MDHSYIDENAVAERYLKHSLAPFERRAFEAHLIDCQECSDRLLLAEMFQTRNGHAKLARATTLAHPTRPDYSSASLILRLRPRDLAIITITLLVALLAPVIYLVLRSL